MCSAKCGIGFPMFSVCNVEEPQSYKLDYFKSNHTDN